MTNPASADLLQPALLDRLTDPDPEQRIESRDRRVISMQRLRESVRRDLAWLLSAGRLETLIDLDEFPEVRRSVLNYGVPDISGLNISGAETETIERAVREAILEFEPRLDERSLRVTVTADHTSMQRNAMVFEIQAELWGRPLPQSILWRSELDLETGSADVRESDR